MTLNLSKFKGPLKNERLMGSRDRSLNNPEFSCPIIMVLIMVILYVPEVLSLTEYGVHLYFTG